MSPHFHALTCISCSGVVALTTAPLPPDTFTICPACSGIAAEVAAGLGLGAQHILNFTAPLGGGFLGANNRDKSIAAAESFKLVERGLYDRLVASAFECQIREREKVSNGESFSLTMEQGEGKL